MHATIKKLRVPRFSGNCFYRIVSILSPVCRLQHAVICAFSFAAGNFLQLSRFKSDQAKEQGIFSCWSCWFSSVHNLWLSRYGVNPNNYDWTHFMLQPFILIILHWPCLWLQREHRRQFERGRLNSRDTLFSDTDKRITFLRQLAS